MKRALVTGGSGAIGAAICRKLAADGLHVFVHANAGLDRAEAVVAEIAAAGGSARAVAFDVTDADATAAGLAELSADGVIQVIVNNAGIHSDAVMAGMRRQQWSQVLDVTLNGFFNVTQPLLLPMIGTRWGRILNISSVSGVAGNRGQVNYSAAKAGIIGATKALALELAKREITVNCVAPGLIETRMIADVPMEDALKLIPMRRAGLPEEVAHAVAFLCSDQASYITRQVLSVNGGMI